MKPVLSLLTLLAVAGCGVDGPPVANSASAPAGVSISGCAAIGVSNMPISDKGRLRC
jgi:hypothetical protein